MREAGQAPTTASESDLGRVSAIERAISCAGGVKKLAAAVGVSTRTVYAWRNGSRMPTHKNIIRIQKHIGQLTDSVIMDSLTHLASFNLSENILPYEDPKTILDKLVFVPKAELHIAGKHFSLLRKKEPYYAFHTSQLHKKILQTEHLHLVEMTGRSMEPTLHDGELCLLDAGDKQLRDECIYLLRVCNDLYIKRFSRKPGYYLFRSDNLEFHNLDISMQREKDPLDWEIMGRILWVGKYL